MDALLVPLTLWGVSAAGLTAWRWWLADKTAARAHEAAMGAQRVAVDQSKLDALPARMAQLEEQVRSLEWRTKK